MMCHCTSRSRMGATSRSQREVIHAHGQIGSNQKSTFICLTVLVTATASHPFWVHHPPPPPKFYSGGVTRSVTGDGETALFWVTSANCRMKRHGVFGVMVSLSAAAAMGAVNAQVLPPPAIGGSPASFEQVFGGANDASIGAILHFQRCAGTDIDQLVLLAPNDQVWTIQREWCQLGALPADQRLADAAQFLPPDAIAGAPFTTAVGESAQSYQSSILAATLPAGLFHDCLGNPVTPGRRLW